MISLVKTAGKARALVVGGACAVMLAGGAGAFAYTASASSTPAAAASAPRVLKACMAYGNNTMIYDWNGAACPSGHYQTSWNQTGPQGPTGEQGPQGPAGTPQLFESTLSNTPDLGIDPAPAPDGNSGTGGWGWDNTTNKAVTDLKAGTTSTFNVGVLQPNGESANGTITLSFNPYDFTYVSNGDSGATCKATSTQVTCSYTDLAHSAKTDGFQFKANHANPDATIGVTVMTPGNEATGTFPVSISS